jgi:hypothetical protein
MTFWDYWREYVRSGASLEGARARHLLERVGRSGPAGRAPCRACGTDDCSRPGCLRARLVEEENLDFRRRLAQHAAAAARDAGRHRNGGRAWR